MALNSVWHTLDALTPLAKQSLLDGVVEAIRHDQEIKESETELLRTICAVLHCPLPPMPGKINERYGIALSA